MPYPCEPSGLSSDPASVWEALSSHARGVMSDSYTAFCGSVQSRNIAHTCAGETISWPSSNSLYPLLS